MKVLFPILSEPKHDIKVRDNAKSLFSIGNRANIKSRWIVNKVSIIYQFVGL